MSGAPFTYRLRVRYHECDGQHVVFNARYAEFIDVAALEFSRAVFGGVVPQDGGIDWMLVKQTLEWKASAVFDDVLDVQVRTKALGKCSFTLLSDILRTRDAKLLASAETVYVVCDERGAKAPIPEASRGDLQAGACAILIDCSGIAQTRL